MAVSYHVDPRTRRLHDGGGTHAGGGVTVQGDGDGADRLEAPHQVPDHRRRQQPGHVLDADGVTTQVFKPAGEVHPVVQVVDRADGVGQGPLGVLAGRQGRLHRGLEVPRVVQGIEDAEDIDPSDRRPLHEGMHQIVGIVAIPEQVLAAQQHLVPSPGHGRLEPAQALPGVFPQVADTGHRRSPRPRSPGTRSRPGRASLRWGACPRCAAASPAGTGGRRAGRVR
jgi:hypothetical protein